MPTNRIGAVAVPADLTTALTPQWLTAALQPRFPGTEVCSVTRGPIVERLSTNARFAIDCAGEAPTDLPTRLCIKGYFSDVGRAIAHVGEPEATFYRDLAEPSGIRTLRSVYADVDPQTRHGVVITEDMVAAGGEFLDPADVFTTEQVSEALAELAKLHAFTWMSPRWSAEAWLQPRLGRAAQVWGEKRTLEVMTANLEGGNGSEIPRRARDARSLLEAHRRVGARSAGSSIPGWCVIHGDAHVGNLIRDGDGRPGLVDWQLVQRGRWQIDVGYLIAATLDSEQRRRSELDLLRHYLECLSSYGISVPSFDQARVALPDGMIHGFFLWSITTKVTPDVIALLLARLGTAVADHLTEVNP
ncbi:aminoglycoside phosphotransferase family protein [Mycolicibacterium farcinogenes]|uniref:aminoglycoside phosphotransferase family protein n=1 Tax=Mycolicibacterium farcinogenes TaxID=1802 RepID=UPI001C8D26FF|nr:aminoglycoside phosphotransferase family protein [Mycolicibacterium farcinogenes]QZH58306.1 aminoglycoside phosphotransferase family protein [Mycolicibacterium farcinogenes]